MTEREAVEAAEDRAIVAAAKVLRDRRREIEWGSKSVARAAIDAYKAILSEQPPARLDAKRALDKAREVGLIVTPPDWLQHDDEAALEAMQQVLDVAQPEGSSAREGEPSVRVWLQREGQPKHELTSGFRVEDDGTVTVPLALDGEQAILTVDAATPDSSGETLKPGECPTCVKQGSHLPRHLHQPHSSSGEQVREERTPQEIVDALRDDAIEAIPDLAVDAGLLAIRSAVHDFYESEDNERRLFRVGVAAAVAALSATSPGEGEG